MEKETEKKTEKTSEKVTEKTTEKTPEKVTEKEKEKTSEKATEKPTEKKVEKKVEKKDNKKGLLCAIGAAIVVLVLVLVMVKGCGKEYTVKFDSNGGSAVESVTVKENETVTKPKDPTREGYEFAGWYLDNKEYDFSTKVTKDITLKAHWTQKASAEINLSVSSMNLTIGSSGAISVSSLPDGYTEEDLVYSSNDEEMATVDETGLITAIKAGTVTITVKTSDGKYTATVTVTIKEEDEEEESGPVDVESVSISGSSSVTVGSSITLKAIFNPTNATDKNVTWSVSDESIATINKSGKLTAKKAGTVTVTVTTANGKTATKKITVKEKSSSGTTPSTPGTTTPTDVAVTGVSISGPNAVNVNSSIQLTANITPSNATNKSVTWSVDNSSVATIDGNGRLTGKSAGTVTVTVRTANGKTATYTVTVKSVYTLTIKVTYKFEAPAEDGSREILYATYTLTEDGKVITNHKGIKYNNQNLQPNGHNLDSGMVNLQVKTATIVFNDGTTAEANVVYTE